MYLSETGSMVTSASDLKLASECEYAFLSVLDTRLGWSNAPQPTASSMLVRAARLGDDHERRHLASLREHFGEGVIEIPKPGARDWEALRAASEATRRALRAGVPAVYQGVFFDEADSSSLFVGYADFLLRQDDGRYRVSDTKLARRVRVSALLQLAAYHDQLLGWGVPVDDTVELILGDGTRHGARIADIAPVFRSRRRRMLELIEQHRAGGMPVRWGDPAWRSCGSCDACTSAAEAADDVCLVSGLRQTQRTKLLRIGISTVSALAATEDATAAASECGLPVATLETLRHQARLQLRSRENNSGMPAYEVFDARPIAALPDPDPADIFFDFEGDPLYREQRPDGSVRWGLDYLFGWCDADERFQCLWAHDHDAERRALIDFVAFVRERRKRNPGMHVYHYAPYEKAHLRSIAARHAVCESEVDELLREGVLVDLYPVVVGAVRLGSRSYSIKKLEPLYMGDHAARSGVDNAADSVEQYERAGVLRDRGADDEAARLLEEIRRYNEYDCVSTLRLRDWLLCREGVDALRATKNDEQPFVDEVPFETSPLFQRLWQRADDESERGHGTLAAAFRLAGAAIDYHRRERKQFWWEHFDRLEQPPRLWQEETRDVFTVTGGEVAEPWAVPPRGRTLRRVLRLRGSWSAGSSAARPGAEIFLRYAADDIPGQALLHRTAAVGRRARVHEAVGDESADLLVVESCPRALDPWSATPTHVMPGEPPRADALVRAIEQWGSTLLEHPGRVPSDAMTELLRRLAPGNGASPVPLRRADDRDHIAAVAGSLLDRETGYLAVQGPPGTGKTYLAARVIQQLVAEHGWAVGVTAQSHRVVENVLEAVVSDAGLDVGLVAKTPPRDAGPEGYLDRPFTGLGVDAHREFAAAHERSGYVLGGTAWDFTNPKRVFPGQLDLLVIDEAGQFSLANTIAVSGSARRILLLGDPQQLPQVSQGVHPAPVDGSALGHILGDEEIIPAEFGFFLAESRRMDARLTEAVSDLSYDGRLAAHPQNARRRLTGLAAGVHPVPVSPDPVPTGALVSVGQHAPGDEATRSSPAEASEVVDIVGRVLSLPWRDEAGERPLGQRDIIVVTPYNVQVETIRTVLDRAGHRGVDVGTVDRFQGREAVISILSMGVSDPADIPRGLDFLLSPNRLNVSISRAKWAAFVVYAPALAEAQVRTPEELTLLSGFLRLVDPEGTAAAPVRPAPAP